MFLWEYPAAPPSLIPPSPPLQRLTKADMELRQLLPEAEALLGASGSGSVEELAREARSRLVTVRQQVPGNILHASVSRKTGLVWYCRWRSMSR